VPPSLKDAQRLSHDVGKGEAGRKNAQTACEPWQLAVVVVDHGKHTEAWPGKVLYGPSYRRVERANGIR
jgi:hypothetical protein